MIDPITSDPRVAGRKRPIRIIARDIRRDWTKPFYAAEPYIKAMLQIDSPSDAYGVEEGHSIIMYFLANAGTWRGAEARRIKAELKDLIKT